MGMGMKRHVGSPRVQDADGADLRTQVLGIGADLEQGLPGGPKQYVVHRLLVSQEERMQGVGDCEDRVEVLDRQQVPGSRLDPFLLV